MPAQRPYTIFCETHQTRITLLRKAGDYGSCWECEVNPCDALVDLFADTLIDLSITEATQ